MTIPPKKNGMGRGLGALGLGVPVKTGAPLAEAENDTELTPEATSPVPANAPETSLAPGNPPERKTGLVRVPITSIASNPYQPRKYFNPEVLAELSQSIRENGLIQPPVVSYNPDYDPHYKEDPNAEPAVEGEIRKERKARYLLIAGERRWLASKLAGLIEIPVVLKEATPLQMLELALVENIQRADLNPLEEAEAYRQLMQEFKLTQESVAQRVGKSRAAVANSLRLLDLPKNMRDAVQNGQITEGHARALLMVHNTRHRQQLLAEIIAKQLSVRQAEETARRLNAVALTKEFLDQEKPIVLPAERETRELETQFRDALKGVRISLIRNNKGAGKLTIQFGSDGELNELFEKIVGADI